MTPHTLSAEDVVAGAGAVGLAFADTPLRESPATIVVVDRRAQPGGHWHDADPFVRLHGPSATDGADSMPLGSGRIDEVGLNRGLHGAPVPAKAVALGDEAFACAVEA